jgi:hypothetical protein
MRANLSPSPSLTRSAQNNEISFLWADMEQHFQTYGTADWGRGEPENSLRIKFGERDGHPSGACLKYPMLR